MAEERILPPFPDELVLRGDREEAIAFLLDLELPSGIAQRHLKRFADVAKLELVTGDLLRVGRFQSTER